MYRYSNQENAAVLRESDGAIIPCDPGNSDYALLIAQGDVIAPYRRFAGKEEALAALGPAIKQECRRRILAIADEDRQRNLTARAVELTLAVAQGAMSSAGAAELADLQAMWARIKALRTASDVKEAGLQTLSLEALESYTLGEGWPE
jgi:hypothetical protein